MTLPTPARTIALVDLGTSHAESFAVLLPKLGYEVTTVIDAPDAPAHRAVDFARRHGIRDVGGSPIDLADRCDVVMLLGPDWDRRFRLACRLLDAGAAVFLDKPLAGTVGELNELAHRVDAGQRIGGGSALRWAPAAVSYRRKHVHTVLSSLSVGCPGHPFYYGVHATSLALAILGTGFVTARALPGSPGLRAVLTHRTGTPVLVDVSPAAKTVTFHASAVADGEMKRIVPGISSLYKTQLTEVLASLTSGARSEGAGADLVEAERALLGIAWSEAGGGCDVLLDEIPWDFRPWTGAAFAAEYST